MRQIAMVGDMRRWHQEKNFVCDMMDFTATRAITINTGCRSPLAQFNLHSWAGSQDEQVAKALDSLYRQGIIDGIFCFADRRSDWTTIFCALPFGTPKVAVVADENWHPPQDVVTFFIPGRDYDLNPIIKTILCNAVFALGGMVLTNPANFPRRAVAALVGGESVTTRTLVEKGINYINFSGPTPQLDQLVTGGLFNGLMVLGPLQGLESCLAAASAQQVPVVVAAPNLGSLGNQLSVLDRNTATIVLATQTDLNGQWPTGVQVRIVAHRYGSPPFYQAAAQTLATLLT